MATLRFAVRATILKPLSPAVLTRAQAIKTDFDTLVAYAVKINQGQPNEESTNHSTLRNLTDRYEYDLDIAIPDTVGGHLILASQDGQGQPVGGIRIPNALWTNLPTLLQDMRDVNTYADKNGSEFHAGYRICYHDEGINHRPCGDEVNL